MKFAYLDKRRYRSLYRVGKNWQFFLGHDLGLDCPIMPPHLNLGKTSISMRGDALMWRQRRFFTLLCTLYLVGKIKVWLVRCMRRS